MSPMSVPLLGFDAAAAAAIDPVVHSPPPSAAASAAPQPLSRRANRVLIYTTCYNVIDGVTLTIRKLEKEILAAGGHVCILTTKSGDAANTNLDGTHPNRRVLFLDDSIPIPFYVDPDNPANQLHIGFSLSRAVVREIDEFGPKVVHITVPDCTGLCVVQYAREREIPLMGTYHSNYVDYMDHYPGLGWLKVVLESFFRHQYNFFQALYVPTPYVRRNLIDRYEMDKVTDLGIWGRGVDDRRFSPRHRSMEFRRNLGIPDDAAVLCFTGRLVAEKSPDIFASVVRRLAARGANFHALVIGCGPCLEMFRDLPDTSCVGWLSGHELAVAYASSDVFVFPSSVETFGNVTLEAAASGLPVVVEAGCSGHLVEDGVNGYACPAADGDAFFRAALDLVVDADRRRKFAERSRAFASTLEDRAVVREMLGNYGRVVDEFYAELGGRHENRDAEVRARGGPAFKGGMYPRPLGLVVIERVFIGLFRLVWWLLGVYAFLQKAVLVTLALAVRDRSSLNRTAAARRAGGTEEEEGKRDADQAKEDAEFPLAKSDPTQDGSSNKVPASSCSLTKFGDGPYARRVAVALTECLALQWRTSSRIWEAFERTRARFSTAAPPVAPPSADCKRKTCYAPRSALLTIKRTHSNGSDSTEGTDSTSASSLFPSSRGDDDMSSDKLMNETCRIRRTSTSIPVMI